MLHLSRRILIVLAWTTPALIIQGPARAACTIFVDVDATGPTHDGTTWCYAYLTLNEGLAAASSSVTICVANGTYTPDPTDRAVTFQLKNGVTIEGGYAGCGAGDPDDRSIVCVGGSSAGELCSDDNDCPGGGTCKYPTILSGDLNGDDDPNPTSNCCYAHGTSTCDDATCRAAVCDVRYTCCSGGGGVFDWDEACAAIASVLCCDICGNTCENSYHVVSADSSVTSSTVLDGVTVRAGLADGSVCDQTSTACDTDDDCSEGVACLHASGGGMENTAASPTVTNCLFRDNGASMCGGGMYNTEGSSPAVSSCTFLDNNTREEGAGMYNDDDSNPTVTACGFTGNAATFGGGVYNEESEPTFTDCTFSANFADAGGGMYNTNTLGMDPKVTVVQGSSCVFDNNGTVWSGLGSAMYNSGSNTNTKVTNCTFRQNEWSVIYTNASASPEFQACRFEDGPRRVLYEVGSTSKYVDCQFVNNTSLGLLGVGSDPEFIGCQFTGTSSGYLQIAEEATFTNCVFDGNSTGPVIKVWSQSSSPVTATFTNCTISNNTGTGIEVFGGSAVDVVKVTNCTITDNRIGIETLGGNVVTVTNSIVWGNRSGIQDRSIQDDQIYFVDAGEVVATFSDIEDDTDNTCYFPCDDDCTMGCTSGTGNIDDNPQFASGVCGSYHITDASPCFDTGDPDPDPPIDCTSNDACDGHLRCTGPWDIIDMGAYEVECLETPDCVGDPSKPVCNTSTTRCVECLVNPDCVDPSKPACNTSTNQCVECVVNTDCVDRSKPVCKTSTNQCVECVSASDCPRPPLFCIRSCVGNMCDFFCSK